MPGCARRDRRRRYSRLGRPEIERVLWISRLWATPINPTKTVEFKLRWFATTRLSGPVRWTLRHRLIIRNSPPSRAVEIVILTALQRPEKPAQARETKTKRQWHENHKDFHHGLRGAT